jgi:hypothetical protein
MAIITTADLTTWLNISDALDSASVEDAALAANRTTQLYCGRSFEVTVSGSESARVFRPHHSTLVYTDDFSSTVNLAVKTDAGQDGTYETTLTLNTDYIVEPLNGLEDGIAVPYRKMRATSWLFPTCGIRPTVQVTARWGWAVVPDDVILATLVMGARLFKRRTSPEGILGGFQDFGAMRIASRDDPDWAGRLNPYVRTEKQFAGVV